MSIERYLWTIWAVIAVVAVAAAEGHWVMVAVVLLVTALMAKAFGPWPRPWKRHSVSEVRHGPAE